MANYPEGLHDQLRTAWGFSDAATVVPLGSLSSFPRFRLASAGRSLMVKDDDVYNSHAGDEPSFDLLRVRSMETLLLAAGLPIPEPVPTASGAVYFSVPTESKERGLVAHRVFSAHKEEFGWMPLVSLGHDDVESVLRQLGGATAGLDDAASKIGPWKSFPNNTVEYWRMQAQSAEAAGFQNTAQVLTRASSPLARLALSLPLSHHQNAPRLCFFDISTINVAVNQDGQIRIFDWGLSLSDHRTVDRIVYDVPDDEEGFGPDDYFMGWAERRGFASDEAQSILTTAYRERRQALRTNEKILDVSFSVGSTHGSTNSTTAPSTTSTTDGTTSTTNAPSTTIAPETTTTAGTTGTCTNPTILGANGSTNSNGYTIAGNFWGAGGANPGATQSLSVCNSSSWSVTANMTPNANSVGVLTYPNVQKNYPNKPTIGSLNTITSSYADQGPNAGSYEFAYDIWLNGIPGGGGQQYEVMIWTDDHGQSTGGQPQGTFTSGGVTYDVFKGNDIAFKAENNSGSGTVNIKDFFNYLVQQKWTSNSSTLWQISYGLEIGTTGGGTQTYKFTNFSANAQ